jgi:hypothetical protein
MSKKKIRTCCLAVDASVAKAAGPLESRHPTGARCRDFLIALRGVGHRIAWSLAIKAEWDKHQGAFAAQWRTSMTDLKKLIPVADELVQELREAIEGHAEDQSVVAIMLKDAHLIEAALATDSRLSSLDENARGHFSRLAATYSDIRPIIWVNPDVAEERGVEWLEDGAPAERFRRLKR